LHNYPSRFIYMYGKTSENKSKNNQTSISTFNVGIFLFQQYTKINNFSYLLFPPKNNKKMRRRHRFPFILESWLRVAIVPRFLTKSIVSWRIKHNPIFSSTLKCPPPPIILLSTSWICLSYPFCTFEQIKYV
jgi:hypothetical protein